MLLTSKCWEHNFTLFHDNLESCRILYVQVRYNLCRFVTNNTGFLWSFWEFFVLFFFFTNKPLDFSPAVSAYILNTVTKRLYSELQCSVVTAVQAWGNPPPGGLRWRWCSCGSSRPGGPSLQLAPPGAAAAPPPPASSESCGSGCWRCFPGPGGCGTRTGSPWFSLHVWPGPGGERDQSSFFVVIYQLLMFFSVPLARTVHWRLLTWQLLMKMLVSFK